MSETHEIQNISLDLLDASPTQPRKHFDQTAHEELVASMRSHGFAFGSLLVRPKPDGRFEIIVGERRTRAARAAGIDAVPCSVRELTDVQVIELQLIENLQRSDLDPMEEAEGYRTMMDLRAPDGSPLHTIETLAARINKDRQHVDRYLRLCNLDAEARQWVIEKKLPPHTGFLIGSLPTAAMRAEAAQEILHPELEPGPLSYRKAEDLIASRYIRDLRAARFDLADASLVSQRCDETGKRVAGGACDDCPLRVARGKGRSSCLNPSCFEEKQEREYERWQERETDAASNRRALSREESAAVFSGDMPDIPAWSSGLVSLAQNPANDELKPGVDAPGNWASLVAGADLEVQVARDRNGKPHELVDRKKAIAAAQQINGHDIFKTSGSNATVEKKSRKQLGLAAPVELEAEPGKTIEQTREAWENQPASRAEQDAERKRSEKDRSATEARQRLIALNCLDMLRKKAKATTPLLRKLVLFLFSLRDTYSDELFRRYKLPVTNDIARNIARWNEAQLVAFAVEIAATDGGFNFALDTEDLEWFKLFGVDYHAEAMRIAKLDAADKKADKRRVKKALTEGEKAAKKTENSTNRETIRNRKVARRIERSLAPKSARKSPTEQASKRKPAAK